MSLPSGSVTVSRTARVPRLSEYAWQLEAYKRALQAAGRKVREVGLLYVRRPSWARWGVE